MRISNIQNFALNAANAIDKCCRPRKTNENNSLERSPMQDTVSFGKYDKNNKDFVENCAMYHLLIIPGNNTAFCLGLLSSSEYLWLKPTKDTLLDPERGKCRLELRSFKEMRPDASEEKVNDYDDTMRNHIKDFNEMNNLEDGWEQELDEPEDFERAAELALYLDNHGYLPGDYDREEPLNIFNMHDRGFST